MNINICINRERGTDEIGATRCLKQACAKWCVGMVCMCMCAQIHACWSDYGLFQKYIRKNMPRVRSQQFVTMCMHSINDEEEEVDGHDHEIASSLAFPACARIYFPLVLTLFRMSTGFFLATMWVVCFTTRSKAGAGADTHVLSTF
jgi:hypothetical protein